jgi:hypothetical protein
MTTTHLIVIVRTDDGALRPVDLKGKQPRQVQGFITHIQGGKLRLRREPITPAELEELTK